MKQDNISQCRAWVIISWLVRSWTNHLRQPEQEMATVAAVTSSYWLITSSTTSYCSFIEYNSSIPSLLVLEQNWYDWLSDFINIRYIFGAPGKFDRTVLKIDFVNVKLYQINVNFIHRQTCLFTKHSIKKPLMLQFSNDSYLQCTRNDQLFAFENNV